jgi:peptidoglycan/LPS O-acetylase OafA/YrhL
LPEALDEHEIGSDDILRSTRIVNGFSSSPVQRGVGLSQRGHYAALDGLRGFAAVSVLLYHVGHWLNAPLLAANAGLAVDFFFCLSGFVLALAYEKRFQAGLGTTQFLGIRLVRLMPLITLATIISSLYVFFRASMFKNAVSATELSLATLLGLLNLPFLTASPVIGGPQVFPLNGPQYSLFLEIVVNIVWSLLRRFNQLWLSVGLFAFCLAILWYTGLGGDEAATFWSGFPRVAASFFAGVAIFHFDQRGKSRTGSSVAFWVCTILMVLYFYYPFPLSTPFELLWIALLSPLLVYFGSKIRLRGEIASASLIGGELSYPIYALHYPIFCWVNGGYQAIMKRQNIAFEGPLFFCCALIGGYVALRMYDEPLRNWLNRRAVG